ncbi:extracellular solute-binding protein [Nesterenkonia salmonea]|uniref:Extracellular solute-binding protein n=1 Tax=Nesterenkonia salmonea TaxID=1804987 RepID=A0A5R9BBQ8_9MICC|nr:extracellular solute-binding protein [Nesterenkonia salmonea]TLP98087.1 extracellular solute-binding protein [Nesterenkonia salmonea]
MSPPLVNRRQFLGGSLAAAGALAFTGCAQTGPANATTVQFWHLLSGGDGITMEGLIDGINAQYSEFFVRPTVLAWGTPYYTKLSMAGAGGRAPELAMMHAARVPGYVPGGLLDPWDLEMLAERGVSEEMFTAPVWESSVVDNQLYSVALDAHPFIALYNRDICEAAGALDSDGHLQRPDSPDDFLEMCREIAAVTGGRALSYGFLGDGNQMWRLFYTLYCQHGVEMSFPQGGTAEFDREAFVSSLEFMHQIADGEIAARQGTIDYAIAEFAGQQTGIHFTGVWELPTMQEAGVPVDATMIPPIFGNEAVYADSHSFVLPHQSEPDDEARGHAYTFVAELLKNSLTWAGAGHIPAYRPVLEDPEYAELLPQANYADAADYLVYDPTAWFTGSGSNFIQDFGQIVGGAIVSGDGYDAAADAFQEHVDAILSRANPANPEEG